MYVSSCFQRDLKYTTTPFPVDLEQRIKIFKKLSLFDQ